MSDGTVAGLVSGRELMVEAQQKRKVRLCPLGGTPSASKYQHPAWSRDVCAGFGLQSSRVVPFLYDGSMGAWVALQHMQVMEGECKSRLCFAFVTRHSCQGSYAESWAKSVAWVTRIIVWQADRERFAQMEAGVSGRGAETVYRDKEGRRVEGPEALAAAAEAEKPKHEKPAWGGGIAQARPGTLLQQSSV